MRIEGAAAAWLGVSRRRGAGGREGARARRASYCLRQASAQPSAVTWQALMHGMLPSQRRLQSVCAVWQRVLQVCTLALAVAHKSTNAAPTNNRIELLTS